MAAKTTRRTALRAMVAAVALALLAAVMPGHQADARGGAETAVYVNGYDSAGFVHIQGDGFTIGGKVEVWVYDDSWGFASDPSDYQVVAAYRYDYFMNCGDGDPTCIGQPATTGMIDLYSGPYCPRLLTIYAHDLTSGTWVSYEYRSSECPW